MPKRVVRVDLFCLPQPQVAAVVFPLPPASRRRRRMLSPTPPRIFQTPRLLL